MGPLSSLKVLDFTTLLPGPFASMILADLGADVLRVESPGRPDLARTTPPLDAGGESVIHRHLNRSKRSLSLDLKHSQAPELIKRLVVDYDVVLEQFRPGVMQRLGVGYEELAQVNPRLIFCSITGYGQDGPYRAVVGGVRKVDPTTLAGKTYPRVTETPGVYFIMTSGGGPDGGDGYLTDSDGRHLRIDFRKIVLPPMKQRVPSPERQWQRDIATGQGG